FNSYGTTLRVYDPDIDAWRIQWTDPVTRNFLQMIGRAEGRDIVQLGTRPDGQLARWSFRDITADSFLWRGEVSADAGATWRIITEFTARRKEGGFFSQIGSPPAPSLDPCVRMAPRPRPPAHEEQNHDWS